MSDGDDWKENRKYVLEKVDDLEAGQEKQAEINRTQSEWNHKTEARMDKISDRVGKITMAIAALTAAVVENAERFFDMLKGLLK